MNGGGGYFEYMAAVADGDDDDLGNFVDGGRLFDGGERARRGEVENEYELVGILFLFSIHFFFFFLINFGVEMKLVVNLQLTRVTDTTSEQARRGKDIQGIPWDRLHITRENYRKSRLEQYKNYENIPLSGDIVDKVFVRLLQISEKILSSYFLFSVGYWEFGWFV